MSDHEHPERTPRWYLLVILIIVSTVGPVATAYGSVILSRRSLAATELNDRRQDCEMWGAMLRVYAETPPSTASGQNVRNLYADLYERRACAELE